MVSCFSLAWLDRLILVIRNGPFHSILCPFHSIPSIPFHSVDDHLIHSLPFCPPLIHSSSGSFRWSSQTSIISPFIAPRFQTGNLSQSRWNEPLTTIDRCPPSAGLMHQRVDIQGISLPAIARRWWRPSSARAGGFIPDSRITGAGLWMIDKRARPRRQPWWQYPAPALSYSRSSVTG